jgi:hypothetical protein
MKSNRMRLYKPNAGTKGRFEPGYSQEPKLSLCLEEMPPPLPIARVTPDDIIEDILISTLHRVQESASPAVAAAAARYISLLSEKSL